MHLLDDVPLGVGEDRPVVYVLEVLDVHFVLVRDLVVHEVVLHLEGLAHRRGLVDVLALVPEVVCGPPVEELRSPSLSTEDGIHIGIG